MFAAAISDASLVKALIVTGRSIGIKRIRHTCQHGNSSPGSAAREAKSKLFTLNRAASFFAKVKAPALVATGALSVSVAFYPVKRNLCLPAPRDKDGTHPRLSALLSGAKMWSLARWG